MKLIIGLGNPGDKYKNNRHNVGYLFVDEAKKAKSFAKKCTFLKSNTFMNSSGDAVLKLIKPHSLKLDDLYVVHDDLDIALGSYKIQFGVGPRDHNGIKDIEEKLGSGDFWRIRVGVENRDPENRTPGEQYVLEDFSNKEMQILDETIKKCLKGLYDKLQ